MRQWLRGARSAALAFALLLAASGPASAEPRDAVPPAATAAVDESPPSPPPGPWYGWQIFLADAAWVTAFSLSVQGHSTVGETAALSAYLAGGPVLRLAHGDPGGAGSSLVRRLLLPAALGLVAGAIGAAALPRSGSGYCDEGCIVAVALVGAGAGASVAMVADWITAREPRASQPSAASPAVVPVLLANRRTAGLGLALRF